MEKFWENYPESEWTPINLFRGLLRELWISDVTKSILIIDFSDPLIVFLKQLKETKSEMNISDLISKLENWLIDSKYSIWTTINELSYFLNEDPICNISFDNPYWDPTFYVNFQEKDKKLHAIVIKFELKDKKFDN